MLSEKAPKTDADRAFDVYWRETLERDPTREVCQHLDKDFQKIVGLKNPYRHRMFGGVGFLVDEGRDGINHVIIAASRFSPGIVDLLFGIARRDPDSYDPPVIYPVDEIRSVPQRTATTTIRERLGV